MQRYKLFANTKYAQLDLCKKVQHLNSTGFYWLITVFFVGLESVVLLRIKTKAWNTTLYKCNVVSYASFNSVIVLFRNVYGNTTFSTLLQGLPPPTVIGWRNLMSECHCIDFVVLFKCQCSHQFITSILLSTYF